MLKITLGLKTIEQAAQFSRSKYIMYKERIKYAVKVIKKLNSEIKKTKLKPFMNDKECQTELINTRYSIRKKIFA